MIIDVFLLIYVQNGSEGLLIAMGILQCLDIDFPHLHHRLGDAIRFFLIFVAHQFHQNRGDDLPGKIEFFRHPTARHRFTSLGKFISKMVDHGLGLAIDQETDSWREFELRSPVQRGERQIPQFKSHRHDACGLVRRFASIVADIQQFRIREKRYVKIGGFFGLRIEPKKRGDVLHGLLLFMPPVFGGNAQYSQN